MYGFRPNRGCHDALAQISYDLERHYTNYVVEADIKGYFDNIKHDKLIKCLELHIKDPNILMLVKKFLKAGYMENGEFFSTNQGTPQGGLLSPLLANIALHGLEDCLNISYQEYNSNSSKNLISLNRCNLDNFENNNNKKEKSFFDNYKLVKIGMKDLGNTSSLNSVLTLLLSIPNFAKYYLKNNSNKNDKDTPFSFEIKQLFLYSYTNSKENKKIYEPISILKFLDKNNVGKNPFEIITYIFKTLHSELNTTINNSPKINPNIYDRNDVIKCEIEYFKNFNNSMISNLFNSFEVVKQQCTLCNTISYSLLTSTNLKLDIVGSYKDKNISLQDCLNYKGKLNQENNFCNKCNKPVPIMKSSKILSLSNLLMIFLDRGSEGSNIPYNISKTLYLKKLVEFDGSPTKYELIGVISTINSTENTKDFVCVSFCKSPIDKNWYYYDNEIVEKTDFDLLISLNEGSYIPQVLLYKSI